MDDGSSLALLNAPVFTTDGTFELWTVDMEEAAAFLRSALAAGGITSYIGDAGTAAVMQTLLNIEVPVSGAEFRQRIGQFALVFSLNAQQAEGVVLSRADIDRIGYTLKILERR